MIKRLFVSAAVISIPAQGAVVPPSARAPIEDVHFVKMPEITVPVVDADAVEGLLRVEIVLAAPDNNAAARLTARMPSLRATSVAAALEFSRLYVSGLNPVDAEHLANSVTVALQPGNPEIARVLVVKVAAAVS